MSTITAVDANSIMMELINSHFTNGITVLYENKAGEIPQDSETWVRPFVRHSGSRQATLTDQSGYKRYDVWGVLFIQLFFPIGKGLETAYTVSEELANVLRKQKSQVTLTRVGWEEVGPDGKFYQFKLTAQFEYSQVR